jgi:SAM-dependent methyltransferase
MPTLASRWTRRLPSPLRFFLREARDRVGDLVEAVRGRDELTPPRSQRLVGRGDFRQVGETFARYFVELGRLQPDDRVLDVGCGAGRIAIPLTRVLSPRGEYRGFDIVQRSIAWCETHVAPRYPNFRFSWCDVHNETYNPGGRCQASDYRFPFEDGGFDFVCAISLFTHMLTRDLEHYVSEIARVTSPGARCLATFFLLGHESRGLIASGASGLRFDEERDGAWVADRRAPENATAYEESFVRGLFERHGFRLEPVRYGAWCGRSSFVSYQDIVVALKPLPQGGGSATRSDGGSRPSAPEP